MIFVEDDNILADENKTNNNAQKCFRLYTRI